MMWMMIKNTLICSLILLLAACSNSSNIISTSDGADSLETALVNRNWTLNQFQGSDEILQAFTGQSTSQFTIRFSTATESNGESTGIVDGVIVCNSYQGEYSIDKSMLSLSNVFATEIACENAEVPPAALFEGVLFGTSNTSVILLDENQLEITSGANEKLIFTDGDSLGLAQLDGGDLASQCNSTFSEPRFQTIRDQQTLNNLYLNLYQSPCTPEDAPQINFENTTVVFIAHELASSGGFSIEISNARLDAGRLVIDVQKNAPGDNCAVTTALTAPYRIYSIAGLYQNVDFNELATLSPPCN